MKELYLQTMEALDITADEIVTKGLNDELHRSTIATLGVLSEHYGKPTAQDIANANRRLKVRLIDRRIPEDEALSKTEELTLIQLYAMRSRVSNYFNFEELKGVDVMTDKDQGLHILKDKLIALNERWYKGCEMFNNGVFQSNEQKDVACETFRDICRKALPIWEQLQEQAPLLLEGLTFLPEPTCEETAPTGKWIDNYTWVPFELLEAKTQLKNATQLP